MWIHRKQSTKMQLWSFFVIVWGIHLFMVLMSGGDYRDSLFRDVLYVALEKLNPYLLSSIDFAINKLRDFESGTLLQKNKTFMDYLQNGVPVTYVKNGEEVSDIAYPLTMIILTLIALLSLINGQSRNIVRNDLTDIIVFLNGLPIVVFELKSPSREETEVSEAYSQLRNYMKEIPSLFYYNAFLVMSDMATSKAGTITAGEDRFMDYFPFH